MTESSFIKPYQSIPIQENGEPLVPIPSDRFYLMDPHPYQALGAPYGDRSPFFVRAGVRDRLGQVQTFLENGNRSGTSLPSHLRKQAPLTLQIFDAYRPIPVQQFMVDYTFAHLAQQFATEQGIAIADLTPRQRHQIQTQVHEFWAVPNADAQQPPPHSTGAAVDVTLVNGEGTPLDMGCPIDECSPRAYPDHFATASTPPEQQFHQNRLLLRQAMTQAGFCNHRTEWWHFSYGDQLWAWRRGQEQGEAIAAMYGRAPN